MNKNIMQKTVMSGYNEGNYADIYRKRRLLTPFEKTFFERLAEALDQGAKILDIGSGPGIPYDLYLVQNGFDVTGIDLSEKHIRISSKNVTSAEYLLGDFLDYSFQHRQFDAVLSLYTLFHIPRDKHVQAILKIASLLKPAGHLLITVGTEDVPYKEREKFCGGRMAWSYYDTETNIDMITQCGFTILETLNEKDYGSSEKHLWILAVKTS